MPITGPVSPSVVNRWLTTPRRCQLVAIYVVHRVELAGRDVPPESPKAVQSTYVVECRVSTSGITSNDDLGKYPP